MSEIKGDEKKLSAQIEELTALVSQLEDPNIELEDDSKTDPCDDSKTDSNKFMATDPIGPSLGPTGHVFLDLNCPFKLTPFGFI
jgi:hypothetical protein